MNDTAITPLVPGAAVHGGLFAGRIRVGDAAVYGLVVAPKSELGDSAGAWLPKNKHVDGADSFFDGAANTVAMA